MHFRSLLAVALAAVVSLPAAASAQSQKASPSKAAPAAQPAAAPAASGAQALSLGGWIGGEWGDLDGFQLRGDVEMPIQKLTPQVGLSFVGAVGYSRRSESASAFGVESKATQNLLKLVPAARFSLPLTPQLSLFGDAGLGLYYSSITLKDTVPGFGTTESDDSALGVMLRFAAGGLFSVNPRMKLGLQLVIDPMFGDHDDTTVSLLAGLTYRL